MDLMAWKLDGYLDFAIRSIVRGNVLHASLSKNWYEACNAECCMPDDVGLRETLLVLKALAVKYTAYGCVHGRPCGMRWYHPHEWRAPVDSVGMELVTPF